MIITKVYVNFEEFSNDWLGQNLTKAIVSNLTSRYIYRLRELDVEGEVTFMIDNDEITKATRKDLSISVKASEKDEKLIWKKLSEVDVELL